MSSAFENTSALTEAKMEEMNEILGVSQKEQRPISITFTRGMTTDTFIGVFRGYDATEGKLNLFNREEGYTRGIQLDRIVDIEYADTFQGDRLD